MSSFKFKNILVVVLLLFVTHARCQFTDNNCLSTNYTTNIAHKASLWGMLENVLSIKKENCVLTIGHQQWQWIKKQWIVDVCRSPVHIKSGLQSIDVIRRQNSCDFPIKGKKDPFCQQYDDLIGLIQDDGLIFAAGERDDLSSDHGKVYCAYLLFRAYLGKEIIFARHASYDHVLPREEYGAMPTPTGTPAFLPTPPVLLTPGPNSIQGQ
ncbi:MAG: hypothetical protein WCG27_11025 [Pseudomonadota bacterium]